MKWKEVRTDPDLLAQLVIKEALSSHCIMQAKISASYRWEMTAQQTQILAVSVSLSSSSLPPPLPHICVFLSLRMDEFNTEVVRHKGRFSHRGAFFTLSDSRNKNQASPLRPPLIWLCLFYFLTLWLLPFLPLPSAFPSSLFLTLCH